VLSSENKAGRGKTERPGLVKEARKGRQGGPIEKKKKKEVTAPKGPTKKTKEVFCVNGKKPEP